MRSDLDRLRDVIAAVDAIGEHLARGQIADGLVFDAVRMRLVEIGEAVKDVDATLLDEQSDIPWIDIARMRDLLARRYFDTAHTIVAATVAEDLPPLRRACLVLLQRP